MALLHVLPAKYNAYDISRIKIVYKNDVYLEVLADSFGDVSIEEFSTDFHKVFLYRYAKGQLIQMK